MASIIAYYRPRGIQGNYKVGIFLDLAVTESAEISRRKNPRPGSVVQQENKPSLAPALHPLPVRPVKVTVKTSLFRKEEGRIVMYVLTQFNYYPEREDFTIKITDKEIAGEQRTRYDAQENEIQEEEQLTVDRFRSRYGPTRANLQLNLITLVDLDIPNNPLIQQYRSEIKQLRQYIEG
jgi:hypothetical protein